MRRADYFAFADAVDRRRRRNRFTLSGTPVLTATNGQAYAGFAVTPGGRYVAPLVYSGAGLPNGITVNPSTGAVSGTPLQTGSFKVDVSVRDAYYRLARIPTFTLVVS